MTNKQHNSWDDNLKDRKTIGELYDLNKSNIDDLAERLWYEYFLPDCVIDAKSRAFIMEQYNTLAKMRNAVAKNTALIITPSLRWQPELKEHVAPGSRKKIYVDVRAVDTSTLRPHQKETLEKVSRKSNPTIVVPAGIGKTGTPPAGKTKHEMIVEFHLAGKTKDQIMEITGFPKKLCTDCIWRHQNQKVKK